MMKFIKSFFAFFLFSLNGIAVDESILVRIDNAGYIMGEWSSFTFRSIENNDISVISKLIQKCDFKKSFPCDIERYLNGWITYQKQGIPYSALVIEKDEIPVAALGIGRVDVLNLNPAFKDIIKVYVNLGVIRFKDPHAEKKYARGNIERIGNEGVGALLPIVAPLLEEEEIKDILKIGIEIFQFLEKSDYPLPLEETIPAYVIGLFHPTDPLISHLQDAGFGILSKAGFRGYHGEPCVMAYFKL